MWSHGSHGVCSDAAAELTREKLSMATKPQATERSLGEIEMQLTVALDLMKKADRALERLGHDDAAATLARISRQIRRVRTTTREQIGGRGSQSQ